MHQGTTLSLASLEEMTVPRNLDLEPAYPYGYGFGLALRRGRVISYGHAGQAPGINFEARYYPDDGITMVIFCNQDNGAYDDLRKNIDKLITGDR
ncbi:MAG: serine hydrolase [bacterium]|nr:serine hydrolase [bacterium]